MKIPRMLMMLCALLCVPLAAKQTPAKGKAGQSKLPPEFQYDTPPHPLKVVKPVYPYGLLHDGIKGSAKAIFVINDLGKVVEVKIVQTTRPEFGAALEAAIQRLTFDPALKGEMPTMTLSQMEQEFVPSSPHGRAPGLLEVEDMDLLERELKKPESIVGASKLDSPLKPVSREAPVFPLALQNKAETGEALLEVIIDQEGKVRLPRVVSASDPAFGYAAVQAVVAWRFEPPKSGGKKTATAVRIPFKFQGHKHAPAPASS